MGCRSWPSTAVDRKLTQYAAGANANFSINGLAVSSASNTVTDVIDGVTLNLLSATSSAITIDVKTDTDTIVADVQAFVDKYNAYATLFKDLTKYDATTGSAGVLQGDSTARSCDVANSFGAREVSDGLVGLLHLIS